MKRETAQLRTDSKENWLADKRQALLKKFSMLRARRECALPGGSITCLKLCNVGQPGCGLCSGQLWSRLSQVLGEESNA